MSASSWQARADEPGERLARTLTRRVSKGRGGKHSDPGLDGDVGQSFGFHISVMGVSATITTCPCASKKETPISRCLGF
jgi:hypothetical protein